VGSGDADPLDSMQRVIEYHIQLRWFQLFLWGHVLIRGLMKQRFREYINARDTIKQALET
jgi:hypothetical protein